MTKRLNRAKCGICGDVIVSRHLHDFVTCSCGNIFVDGGNDYWRYGAKDASNCYRYKNRKWINSNGKLYINITKFKKITNNQICYCWANSNLLSKDDIHALLRELIKRRFISWDEINTKYDCVGENEQLIPKNKNFSTELPNALDEIEYITAGGNIIHFIKEEIKEMWNKLRRLK